jgi:hypothetical protein
MPSFMKITIAGVDFDYRDNGERAMSCSRMWGPDEPPARAVERLEGHTVEYT